MLLVSWTAEEHEAWAEDMPCNYYAVLESQSGAVVATEMTSDGSFLWLQNPNNLEDRNSDDTWEPEAPCSTQASPAHSGYTVSQGHTPVDFARF